MRRALVSPRGCCSRRVRGCVWRLLPRPSPLDTRLGASGAGSQPLVCHSRRHGPWIVAAMQAEGTGTPEPYTLAQRCLAEALGVGIIVTGGCGAVCAAKYAGAPLGHFGIASAFGLSVALAVYATRDISGAHLNPAITASLFVNADCPAEDVAPYCAAQMVGATVGALINYAAYNVSWHAWTNIFSTVCRPGHAFHCLPPGPCIPPSAVRTVPSTVCCPGRAFHLGSPAIVLVLSLAPRLPCHRPHGPRCTPWPWRGRHRFGAARHRRPGSYREDCTRL